MNAKERHGLVIGTELEIAQLLADLEKRSGRVVEGISMDRIETTTIASEGAEYVKRVSIELSCAPGEQWVK